MNNETARVIAEHKGAYEVKTKSGEYFAKITGKQVFAASSREDYPAVGDWVNITVLGADEAVINGILPRRTIIKRRSGHEIQVIATNVDVAFVVESVDRDYSLNRFERYFALAKDGGVAPVIILNKVDLLAQNELNEKIGELQSRFPSFDIIPTSTESDEGLDSLRHYIAKDRTYCFLGSSGVGKSSLINKLLGEEMIKTKSVSEYSGRGKHTTTSRQMYFLVGGGMVIDNPGVREVGMVDAGGGVDSLLGAAASLAKECRYADCTHTHEPGCRIIKAVEDGALDGEKYANYLNLKKEVEYYEMDKRERREDERRFGKMINRAKKDLKNQW